MGRVPASRANLAAVGKGHGGWAVPRLHHGRMVFVEGAARFVHVGVLLPCLGDHHHHGVGQRIARHHQQLQTVVEGGRIRLAFVDNGVELGQVRSEHCRLHRAFAGAQPVEVSLDRIDFAVVSDHAVRVSERPGGEGIGGKSLVHHGERRHGAAIGQVAVVAAHLVGQQQPFVDHRTHRDRRHEIFLAMREPHMLDRMAGRLADHIELAFQGVGHHDVCAASDEQLADDGLARAHRGRHRHVRIDGHVAPTQHDLAFIAHGAFQFLLTGQPRCGFLGQEYHGHAIFIRRRQRNALRGHVLAVQRIGYLNQDAGAVPHQFIGPHCAAVIQIFQDFQALLDDGMAFPALDVGNETHATGIVLVGGAV